MKVNVKEGKRGCIRAREINEPKPQSRKKILLKKEICFCSPKHVNFKSLEFYSNAITEYIFVIKMKIHLKPLFEKITFIIRTIISSWLLGDGGG